MLKAFYGQPGWSFQTSFNIWIVLYSIIIKKSEKDFIFDEKNKLDYIISTRFDPFDNNYKCEFNVKSSLLSIIYQDNRNYVVTDCKPNYHRASDVIVLILIMSTINLFKIFDTIELLLHWDLKFSLLFWKLANYSLFRMSRNSLQCLRLYSV